MDAIDGDALRASFVNCSKSAAKKIVPPPELDRLRWDRLDFLGWRDAKAPQRGYLVVPVALQPVGIVVRAPTSVRRGGRGAMCDLCMTQHPMSDVVPFVAPRAGAAGRNGDTLGSYICANLQCSRYLRGDLKSGAVVMMRETIPQEEKIARLRHNVERFALRVLGE